MTDNGKAMHTPGPWVWDDQSADWHTLRGAGGETLLYYTTGDDGVWCENAHDKPLLAAAPEMLASLQLVNQFYGEDSDVFYAVRAAIAKATGAPAPALESE